jgi:hypothetical protein
LGQPFIAETVFPHPSKLELIDTGHAAGYTAVHWSPKRSCDARKPRSTTTAAAKAPHRGWDDRRIRRRLPRLAGLDTGAASRALADAIDRRSSNTKAGAGEGADDDANPRSAKHTAVTAPIPEAVREITRRLFGDSWTSVIRGGGGAS